MILFKFPINLRVFIKRSTCYDAQLSLSGFCTGGPFQLEYDDIWVQGSGSVSESHPPQRVVSRTCHLPRLLFHVERGPIPTPFPIALILANATVTLDAGYQKPNLLTD